MSRFKTTDEIFNESAAPFLHETEWKVGDLVQTPWGKIARITKITQRPKENGYSGYYNVEGDVFCHLGLHLRRI